MMNLSPEAQQRLDQFLRQVHHALSGCHSVSAAEVERDVREHIESELSVAGAPVSLQKLNDVLQRLGSPDQWAPPDELPWWRRLVNSLRTGPEDWRLAYLSFGLLALTALVPHLFWCLIPLSYLVSRAALAAARPGAEAVEAQRWFIYPSLFIVDVVLLALVLFTPPFLAGTVTFQLLDYHYTGVNHGPPDFSGLSGKQVQFILFVMAAAAGAWWSFVGIFLTIWPSIVAALLRPFGDRFERKHAKPLIYLGLGMVALVLVMTTLGIDLTVDRSLVAAEQCSGR
jgi:hypothetical protein